MTESEPRYHQTPRDVLQHIYEKGRRGILYNIDSHTRSPREEFFVKDAEKKAAEYIDKNYSPRKTLEKIAKQLGFKQFAYLIMTEHDLIQQMEEEKVGNTLRIMAQRRRIHLERSKSDLLIGLQDEQRKRSDFFIRREIDTLNHLHSTLGSQESHTPLVAEGNHHPLRTRR